LKNSILLAVSDSETSWQVLDYFTGLSFCADTVEITLLHVFRDPWPEELMGIAMEERPREKIAAVLEKFRDNLIENGFNPRNIKIKLTTEPYPSIADGIIEEFKKGDYNTVVLGRRKMSKAEEFVLGDVSMKLVRTLEGAGILVVKLA
jgi:nucleotide-binding universal stress UspA family protein